MVNRFRFIYIFLIANLGLFGCSEGVVESARLGFAVKAFSVQQGGVDKTTFKIAAATDSSTFSVKCLSSMNVLLASFDGGNSFAKIADLACDSGESSVTLSFAASSSIAGWPQASAKIFPMLLKAVGSDVESRTVAVEFARPQFETSTLNLSINGGAGLTSATAVTLTVFAQQIADSRKFSPTKTYVTSSMTCDSGGSWVQYSLSVPGVALSVLNSVSPISVKFADEVGNESTCIHASILHDNIAPPALTFLINGGIGRTFTPSASLTLAAGDPLSPGDAKEMTVSNTNDCSGAPNWRAYATSLPWTLASGSNQLSVKFRDLAGNESACIGAVIVYDNNPPVTPTSLTLAAGVGSTDSKNPVDILVAPVLDGDTATLYSDASCLTSVASGTGSVNKAIVSVNRGTQGLKTYYAKVVNALAASSGCSTTSVAYNYDSVGPTVVGVTTVEPNGNFVTGSTVNIKVQFTEPVYVTGGTPTLALGLYAGTANPSYMSGSGTSTLIFSYTVSAGDLEDDLDYASTTALALNGATIRDLANNDADATLPALAGPGSLAANQNIKVNYVVNVARVFGPTPKDYFRGENLDFIVQFDNPVTVTGSVRLRVNINGSFQYVAYSAVRSTVNKTDMLFSSPVTTGLASTTGVTLEAIELNGGSINNLFGSPATLSFTAIPFPGLKIYNLASRVTAGFADTAPFIVRETDGTVGIPLVLSATSTFDTLIKYRVVSNGTATSADHTLTDGTLTIPAGSSSGAISFSIISDSLSEGTEAFAIHLYDVSPGALNANTYKHVYIIDTDPSETVTKLVTASELGCALYSTGRLSCWGDNSYGQLGIGNTLRQSKAVTVFNSGVTAVAAGGRAVCAVHTGLLKCWGDGSSYQLGNGSTLTRTSPFVVTALSGVTDIAMGASATCAIYNSGSLSCWGSGTNGQLGNNSTATVATPSAPILSNVSKVSVGIYSACASSGLNLYCWGSNSYGQLGIGNTTSKAVPTLISPQSSESIVDVKHASYAVCILTSSGSVYCWGYSVYGSTGSGNSTNISSIPASPILTGATALSSMGASGYEFCATLGDKTVKCWGSGNYLGVTSSFTPKIIPVTGVTQIAPGFTTSGGFLCYTTTGLNSPQCTAQTDTSNVLAPSENLVQTAIPDRKVRSLSLQSSTSGCLTTDTGSVECVGGTAATSLGDGAILKRTSAVQIFSGAFSKVYAGYYVNCAIRSDKTLWCFSSDSSYGLPGDGGNGGRPFPVLIMADVTDVFGGTQHTCALKTNQQLYCWGYNSNGQVGTPSLSTYYYAPNLVGSGVTSASAGLNHTCAIISGTVKCWGAGTSGQIGDGSNTDRLAKSDILNLTNATPLSVSLGGNSSCALFGPGDVRCWGENTYGQLGRGSTAPLALPYDTALSSSKSVYTANRVSCGLKITGELYCWGNNSSGAIGNGTLSPSAVSTAYGPLITNPLDVWVSPISVCTRNAADVTSCAGDLPSGLLTPFIGDSYARPVLGFP